MIYGIGWNIALLVRKINRADFSEIGIILVIQYNMKVFNEF